MNDAICVTDLGNGQYKINGQVWTHEDLEMMLSLFFKHQIVFDGIEALSMLLFAKKIQEEEISSS